MMSATVVGGNVGGNYMGELGVERAMPGAPSTASCAVHRAPPAVVKFWLAVAHAAAHDPLPVRALVNGQPTSSRTVLRVS